MEYVIVTGGNDMYINTLIDFIESYKNNNINLNQLVIYNYGLNESNLNKILNYKSIYNFNIVDFDYNKYPEHVDLHKYNGLHVNYAFKVISIYNECVKHSNKKIIWMDSANRFSLNTINHILNIITNEKFYSPISSQPASIESLELHHIDSIKHFGLENDLHLIPQRASGIIGVDYSDKIGNYIINEWYKCALIKNIIAPEGSSRNNHRQDQSVLTLIMYLYEKVNNVKFYNNNVNDISFWNKKDNNRVESEYKKFQITNLESNVQESTIYCNSKEEAIDIYCLRKQISKNELINKYLIL
jgi:hypothetical protein